MGATNIEQSRKLYSMGVHVWIMEIQAWSVEVQKQGGECKNYPFFLKYNLIDFSNYVHFDRILHPTGHKMTYRSWISLIKQRNLGVLLIFRLFSPEKVLSLWCESN